MTTVDGNNIVVRCLANGTVKWYKYGIDSYKVTDNPKSVVHVENGGTDLHIGNSILDHHTGVYSCRVSNLSGQQVTQLFLVVYNNVTGEFCVVIKSL